MGGKRRHIFSGAMIEELTGYARAVVVGKQIYVSGTTGVDQESGDMAEGIDAQAEHALDNIAATLTEADSGLPDIVRVRTYLVDMNDAASVAKVLKSRIGMYYPAMTTVGATLSDPGALVEIEVEAVRDSGLQMT